MHQLAVAKMSSRGGDVVGSGIGATALVGNSATSLKGWQFALWIRGGGRRRRCCWLCR